MRKFLLSNIVFSALAVGAFTDLNAATYYWDGANMAADGTISGGTGNWNVANTNWTNANGTVNNAWPAAYDNAVFSATSGTVSVASGQLVGNLTFSIPGYTIQGTSLTFANDSSALITTPNSGTTTINSQVIGNNVAFSKDGAGTLVLGGNNTATGSFSINDGTLLAMNAVNQKISSSGTFNVGDGIGAAGSAVLQMGQNNTTPFDNVTTLNLNSDGVFDLNGKITGGSNVVRTLTVNFNGGSMVGNGASSTGGGALTTSSNNVSTATTLTFAGSGTYKGAGGDVTVKSPGSGLTGTQTGGLATLAVNAGAKVDTQGGNITLASGNNGGTTVSASVVVSSTGGGTIDTGAGALIFGTGSNNLGTATSTISRVGVAGDSSALSISGNVFLGLPSGGASQSNRQLILNSTGISAPAADNLVISAVIANGSGNSNNGITKQGAMSVALTGINTYTGSTNITAGTVYAVDGVGLPAASLLRIGGTSAIFESNGTFTRALGTSANEVSWGSGGFSARNGALTVAIGGTAAPTALTVNSTANFVTNAMAFGSSLATDKVELVNAVNFNSATVNLTVTDNINSTSDYAEMSGLLTGAGTMVKLGSGLLVLSNSGNSASSLAITASNGVVRATSLAALPGGNLLLSGTGARAILETSGTFTRNLGTGANQVRWATTGTSGFAAYGGDLHLRLNNGTGNIPYGAGNFIGAAGSLAFGSATSNGTVYFDNGFGLSGSGTTNTVNVVKGVGSGPEVVFSNTISNAGNINKTGNGRMAISSTSSYTGSTTVSEGTLLVTGGGSVNTTSGITVNGAGAEFSYQSSVGLTQAVTIGASGGKFTYNSSAKYTGGTITAGNGAIVGGSGVLGNVVINSGGILSPGNSPGNLTADTTTWAGGGTYVWEMNNASGAEGVNWDLLTVSAGNNLDITATSGSKFTISLYGLTAGNVGGVIPGFDSSQSYAWTIATVGVGGSITGFDLNAFTLDTANFINNNPVGPGTFTLAVVGNDLNLVYSIPEPSTVALLGLGLAGVLLRRRRR